MNMNTKSKSAAALVGIVMVWLACGTFNFGANMGYFCKKFPYESNGTPATFDDAPDIWATYKEHAPVSVFMAAGGPIATPAVLLSSKWLKSGFVYLPSQLPTIWKERD
jgi:hypothetical protein